MLKSMTSFGRERASIGGKDITVEMKSVNNRYLDVSVKLPRAYSYLEEKIKPHLQSKGIARGKVDIFISIERTDTPDVTVSIDKSYTTAYVLALRALRDDFDLADDISVMSVARNTDVFIFGKPEDDTDKDWQDLSTVLDGAIERFCASREREGENIYRDICAKVELIKKKVTEIEKLSAEDTQSYRQKLEARLRDMLSDNRLVFDENRILTECALFADKVAIDEELVRLRSHFDGFYGIVSSDEPAGRRLDFLIQEMNRETNTIGSKCQNSAIARLVVDIKCEIEKIREQIQNVE